jgi:hypothetical protein
LHIPYGKVWNPNSNVHHLGKQPSGTSHTLQTFRQDFERSINEIREIVSTCCYLIANSQKVSRSKQASKQPSDHARFFFSNR